MTSSIWSLSIGTSLSRQKHHAYFLLSLYQYIDKYVILYLVVHWQWNSVKKRKRKEVALLLHA
mgnify:CR=1 FL=1